MTQAPSIQPQTDIRACMARVSTIQPNLCPDKRVVSQNSIADSGVCSVSAAKLAADFCLPWFRFVCLPNCNGAHLISLANIMDLSQHANTGVRNSSSFVIERARMRACAVYVCVLVYACAVHMRVLVDMHNSACGRGRHGRHGSPITF
jgi:hypothetical protein